MKTDMHEPPIEIFFVGNEDRGIRVEINHARVMNKCRVHVGDKRTLWGNYDDVFVLDDIILISPAWHRGREWKVVTPDEVVRLISVKEQIAK